MLRNFGLFVLAVSFSAMASTEEPVENQAVLSTPEFDVTTRDFHYYVKRQIPKDRRDQILSQEGMVRKIYQNLYVIKAFAQRGKKNQAIPEDELEWMTQHFRNRQLMNSQIQSEVQAALEETDWEQAAREEYTANKEQYKRPEKINADHILIGKENRSADEALERAREARQKLLDGASFEEVAVEYSDAPSVDQNKGALGFFSRGKMVKPFSDAAFAMEEPGEISEPVKTKFGYHVIRFNERKEAEQQSFDEAKDRIIANLRKEKAKKLRADILEEVKTGATDLGLEVNAELLQQQQQKYGGKQNADPAQKEGASDQ